MPGKSEKPSKANGWVLTNWVERGTHIFISSLASLGGYVLSLCGGSGSLMEAAMHCGRGCLMFESNRTYFTLFFHVKNK